MLVKKLDLNTKMPTTPNPGDAGHDLYSCEDVDIYPKDSELVSTGISFEIPQGQVGLIWDRSGMAVKQGITVLAGCIDSSYRGEIKVLLYNTGRSIVRLPKGSKIAQILFLDYHVHRFVETQELSQTDRQEKGFGSSGT